MKVRCIDKSKPRSDGKPGQPTGLTIGKTYKVAEVLNSGRVNQYSIINDDFKIARYNQDRFEVVDDTQVQDLRTAFNWLTTELRSHIKYLESKDTF